jgi:hypothetical protein
MVSLKAASIPMVDLRCLFHIVKSWLFTPFSARSSDLKIQPRQSIVEDSKASKYINRITDTGDIMQVENEPVNHS